MCKYKENLDGWDELSFGNSESEHHRNVLYVGLECQLFDRVKPLFEKKKNSKIQKHLTLVFWNISKLGLL